MNKFSELIIKINSFSIDAHWEYKLAKFAKDTQTLLAQADEFDIKDEELFNQFESFINAYRELIATLGISSDNLSTESFEEAAQLIDTLKTRYDRIIKNPYLNAGSEEDFDPGTFTQFLNDVAQDAENKLKSMAGEDIDISEMRAAQYAREFNTIDEEYKGTKEDAWSAERVQRALEARRNWFRNLMLKKKLNINDPDYQKYIESRRQSYQSIISDPERKEAYREKARSRQTKFRKKLDTRKKEIYQLLERTRDSKKIQELQNELQSIDTTIARRQEKGKQIAQKVTEIKSKTNSLESAIVILNQNISNVKMGIKKEITKHLLNQEFKFKPYIDKINQAAADNNSALLEEYKKELQKILNAEAENDPSLLAYKEQSIKYSNFLNQLKIISKLGWMNPEISLEEIRPHLEQIKNEGELLLKQNDLIDGKDRFNSHKATIRHIIDKIINKRLGLSEMRTAMNKKDRIKALKQIIAESIKEKLTDSNQADNKDYGHKIFEELLNNLYIKELDD